MDERNYQNENPQQSYQQQYAQQPPINTNPYPQYDPTTQVMSVGEYIGLFIVSAIPIVNIICWIVWLCSSNTNKNKKNYLIANIVLYVIFVIIMVLVIALGGASLFALSSLY